MYYVNEKLIRSINMLFGMSQKAFSAMAFGAEQFYPHRLGQFHLFTVADIVRLSNATHIPIRHFFCDRKNGTLPSSLSSIRHEREWQDVTVNFDQIRKVSLGDGYTFSRQELLGFLKVDVSCFWRWVNASFKMRAQMLCDMCNEFGIDLGDVINDPNDIIPPAPQSRYTSKTLDQLDRMKRRMDEQRQMIENQKQQVEQTENERDAALDAAARAKSEKTIVKTQYITETIEPQWEWQARHWGGDEIPTLTQLIGYCNRHRVTTLLFLSNPKRRTYSEAASIRDTTATALHTIAAPSSARASTDTTTDTIAETIADYNASRPTFTTRGISLDYMAYTMLMQTLGVTDTPDTISIVRFCRILADNHLTPACCINDPDANYTTTLPDRLVRALGNAGITA